MSLDHRSLWTLTACPEIIFLGRNIANFRLRELIMRSCAGFRGNLSQTEGESQESSSYHGCRR